MFEYLSESSVDDRRDILSEIDAGELDERYLIKHAGDYGKHATSHPLSALKAVLANLLNLAMRSSAPREIGKSVRPSRVLPRNQHSSQDDKVVVYVAKTE